MSVISRVRRWIPGFEGLRLVLSLGRSFVLCVLLITSVGDSAPKSGESHGRRSELTCLDKTLRS